jgi:HTH-type transcriptional regulator/antitoxin HigA
MKATEKKISKKKGVAKPVSTRESREKKVLIAAKAVPAIKTERSYRKVMAAIDELMQAGRGTIRNKDMAMYRDLAGAAQAYEERRFVIEPPRTLEGLLEWKMYELKLKQKAMAKKLHISDAKLSLVMSGKQKPDASLLKSIHDELGIDGNVLLSIV